MRKAWWCQRLCQLQGFHRGSFYLHLNRFYAFVQATVFYQLLENNWPVKSWLQDGKSRENSYRHGPVRATTNRLVFKQECLHSPKENCFRFHNCFQVQMEVFFISTTSLHLWHEHKRRLSGTAWGCESHKPTKRQSPWTIRSNRAEGSKASFLVPLNRLTRLRLWTASPDHLSVHVTAYQGYGLS